MTNYKQILSTMRQNWKHKNAGIAMLLNNNITIFQQLSILSIKLPQIGCIFILNGVWFIECFGIVY